MNNVEVKLFEVRDRATHIPVMATRVMASVRPEDYPLRRAGFSVGEFYVLLTKLAGETTHYDPYDWRCGRTLAVAHDHIIQFWDDLASGDVLDAEFILGESATKKLTERLVEEIPETRRTHEERDA